MKHFLGGLKRMKWHEIIVVSKDCSVVNLQCHLPIRNQMDWKSLTGINIDKKLAAFFEQPSARPSRPMAQYTTKNCSVPLTDILTKN